MKTLLIVAGACLFLAGYARPAAAADGTGELLVSVRLTTGEHSKDSGSQTTTITVGRERIAWEQTFGGSSRRRPAPARKSFRLSPADKGALLKLIKANNLLVTDSIALPRAAANYRYFELSADLTLDGRTGAIKISGMRTAVQVREERLYQNTLALVKELYRIMNSRDQGTRFEELILEPLRQ